ncbi:hypothetical protein HY480_00030 [Candidatus Uhrbacteria bacterium]|nr:hypothetical protein [Candidatus Uhrbacteria bacterium]
MRLKRFVVLMITAGILATVGFLLHTHYSADETLKGVAMFCFSVSGIVVVLSLADVL